MKKSIHTLLTAALFATANLSATPVVAEDGASVPKPEAAEPMLLSEQSEKEGDTDSVSADGLDYKILKATTKSMATVYGPPPTTTVNTTAIIDTTTTTVQPVYGTQPTTKLISETSTTSTVTNTDITTTAIFTTTTAPQPVYGPPLQDFVGDVNFDGNVDSFDLVAVRKMLVKGTDKYSDAQMEAYYADMNNDKKLTIADLLLLQEYVLGKVTKEELQQRFNYWFGSHDIEIEQITTSQDINTTTTSTTTTIYYPIQDTIVTLYGIAPSRNVREQMINPNRTTKTTANQPEQSEEK